MEEEDFVGCISCMSTTDLCNLFAVEGDNVETYGQMLETCFGIKVSNDLKFICTQCIGKLSNAADFKEQTSKNLVVLQNVKEEEYLDESILEEAECQDGQKSQKVVIVRKSGTDNGGLEVQHGSTNDGSSPWSESVSECDLCGVWLYDGPQQHMNKCHGVSDCEKRQYPCHFCDNVYKNRKACFTHLRMKHGLKLSSDQAVKCAPRERKQCPVCNRDFSQKQILNKHLTKAHGFELEKRKAFRCPVCGERVSYGAQFSAHLAAAHRLRETVERLQFRTMDDFLLFKSAIQEETKYRFRKTTASKQTIEGLRSHYMCSQSGVYVYQGKGKRAAPERQIYKSGRACPAHMVVTQARGRVLLTFHRTHVGHGACPYYEPRERKKPRPELEGELKAEGVEEGEGEEASVEEALWWVCDSCGARLLDSEAFKEHVTAHNLQLFQCHHCDTVFQNIEAWNQHQILDHPANN